MNPDEQDSQIVVPDHDFHDFIPGSPNFDSNFGTEGQNSVHNPQHKANIGPMLGGGNNSPTKETQPDSIGTHVTDTQYTGLEAVSFQSTEADAQASPIVQNSLVSRVGDTQFTAIEAMEAETQALCDSPRVGEFSPTSQRVLATTHASIPVGAPVVNNGSFIVLNRPEAHVVDLAAGFTWGQAKRHTGDNFSRLPGKKNNPKSEPSHVLKQPLALPSNENGIFSIPNLYVC